MAENLLQDTKLRAATAERNGLYLRDGGGLRFRLLKPSANHRNGARLAEFHFKLKAEDGTYKSGALHLGTIGDPFTDATGKTRPFTLADARSARNAARELVAKGIDPRQARRLSEIEAAEAQRHRLAELDARQTVKQAFERWRDLYLADVKNRKDAGTAVAELFERHVLPTVGELPLEGFKRGHVADLLDRLMAKGLRRTANMTLSLLRQFVRYCAVRDWIAHDPTLALSKANFGGKEKPRDRALSVNEIVELRERLPDAKLPERIGHALWLILATGCRVGELAGARAVDFDLPGRLWHLPETKNGTAHIVHLSDFALRHADALLKTCGPSAYVLPGRGADVADGDADNDDENGGDRPVSDKLITKMVGDRQRTTPLKGRSKAVATLLLARGKWTPHDLRRTLATRMREDLNVSSDVIERCLNHTPQGIVATYQTGTLMAERKAAFEAWGQELDRLMTAQRSNVVELPARVAA